MARLGRGPCRRSSRWKRLVALGLEYLSDADSVDEELDGLFLLEIALQLRRQETQSKRCGPRGPYHGERAPQFLQLLLHRFSPRRFKTWFR